MFRTTGLIAGLVLSVVASSSISAVAQPNQATCTDRTSALAHLAKNYEEKPIAMGLASSGGVLEVLTNEKGSSWSIIVTMPSGMTCLVAAGEGWENLKRAKAGSKI